MTPTRPTFMTSTNSNLQQDDHVDAFYGAEAVRNQDEAMEEYFCDHCEHLKDGDCNECPYA